MVMPLGVGSVSVAGVEVLATAEGVGDLRPIVGGAGRRGRGDVGDRHLLGAEGEAVVLIGGADGDRGVARAVGVGVGEALPAAAVHLAAVKLSVLPSPQAMV